MENLFKMTEERPSSHKETPEKPVEKLELEENVSKLKSKTPSYITMRVDSAEEVVEKTTTMDNMKQNETLSISESTEKRDSIILFPMTNANTQNPFLSNSKNPSYLTLKTRYEDNEDPVIVEESFDEHHKTVKKEIEEKKKKTKLKRSIILAGKLFCLLPILYCFVCSLDLLTSGFQLLAGKVAGKLFAQGSLLRNPFAGLMIGVLVTILVQSSSTTTSIVVSMVSADIQFSIPIIMGANIGTSTTNTLVALGQIDNLKEFRRAFAGATIHDVFNWLNVVVQLPLQILTNYLGLLTGLITKHIEHVENVEQLQFLNAITKPLTELIIQINWTVVEDIALNLTDGNNVTLKKLWCTSEIMNGTEIIEIQTPCKYLLKNLNWADWGIGLLLTLISLALLITCLLLLVKLLRSLLEGHISKIIRKTIDKDLPGHFRFITPYLFLLFGCFATILVQSSSVFTSALTPLVGAGVISLKRMYPLTIGSNIGTTITGILAAFASKQAERLKNALQAALCHLFFNVFGVLLWFVVPQTRRIPIYLAKLIGKETEKYRWFVILYLLTLFLILPLFIFGLSVAGMPYALTAFAILVISFVVILTMNYVMKKHPKWLPARLRTWKWLPEPLRSLAPYDRAIARMRIFGRSWLSSHLIRPDTSVTSMDRLVPPSTEI